MSDNYDGPQMAQKILRQQAEIERLREEIRLHVSVKDKLKEEIERQHELLYMQQEAIKKKNAEIERLRELNRDITEEARDTEIERLRGLLRDGIALMSSRNREEWRKRVREALGDKV